MNRALETKSWQVDSIDQSKEFNIKKLDNESYIVLDNYKTAYTKRHYIGRDGKLKSARTRSNDKNDHEILVPRLNNKSAEHNIATLSNLVYIFKGDTSKHWTDPKTEIW